MTIGGSILHNVTIRLIDGCKSNTRAGIRKCDKDPAWIEFPGSCVSGDFKWEDPSSIRREIDGTKIDLKLCFENFETAQTANKFVSDDRQNDYETLIKNKKILDKKGQWPGVHPEVFFGLQTSTASD